MMQTHSIAKRCLRILPGNGNLWRLVLMFAILSQFVHLNHYVDTDESVFFIVARGMAQGQLPYRDLFDHKPPGIYCVARAAMYLSDSLLSMRIFLRAINIVSGLLVYAMVKALFPQSERHAAISAILYLGSVIFYGGTEFTTEPFMVPFLVLASITFLRGLENNRIRLMLASGLLLGVSSQFKQMAVLVLAAYALYLGFIFVLKRNGASLTEGAKDIAALLAGYVVLTVSVALIFYCLGVFTDYWLDVWSSTIGYAMQFSLGSITNIIGYYKYKSSALYALTWAILLLGAGSMARNIRRRTTSASDNRLLFCLVCALAILSTLIIRQYQHYVIPALPFISVFCGYYIDRILGHGLASRRSAARAANIGVVVVSLLVIFQFVPFVVKTQVETRNPAFTLGYQRSLAQYIKDHIEQNRTILVPLEPAYYYLSGLMPPDRNIYYFPVNYARTFNETSVVETAAQGKVQFVVFKAWAVETLRNDPVHYLHDLVLYLEQSPWTVVRYNEHLIYEAPTG